MDNDPFDEFKARQRAMWASFAPTATLTTPVAAHLVGFAGITPGERVLDVACGTGVVAITAALCGAEVAALDLTPTLLDRARENEQLAACGPIAWQEGDCEKLPYPDGHFDVVVSQFGHMFAPRPDVALAEMRRVLRPGGRIAFATWPPEHFVGRFFALVARHAPPPPPGASPPTQWGSVAVIVERLANGFGPPFFERGVMHVPALSLGHLWHFMSASIGPLQKLTEAMAGQPARLGALRGEMMALAAPYFADNIVRQDYLLTRAALA